ncbi:putative protein kinase CMGC-CDKL-Cr family [Helianthus annuus]|nr:putative protein kinase CMGC-CDKL-Cr family [Helianthus annuus]
MMMISGTLTKFIFSPGPNKSVCAPEPYDVGRILQVDIISNAQKSTVTTDCPTQPAVGLESYVETLSRKGNSEFSLMTVIKYCHDMGVVHRDVKPENILLTTSGKIKLPDFGLAMRITNGSSHKCYACVFMILIIYLLKLV